jgi:PAS domain S-box-containing protein
MVTAKATKLQFFIALLILLLSGQWSWATGVPKRVLLLDSYGRNVTPISKMISAFRTELSSRWPEPIDLHEVSLEMARIAQPGQEVHFIHFLKERLYDRSPDLVVSFGGPAFTFLVRNREDLFPSTPMLFAGVAEQVLRTGQVPRNAAVVPVPIDVRGMIENMLQVLPATENIAVILGTSPLETFWLNECRREFAAFSTRVNFAYLDHLPFQEIIGRVAALPPKSAVFYGLLIVDAAGAQFDPADALKAIIANANSAVFAMHESFFGLGIVGGELIRERAGGVQAAEAALRILQGEPAVGISIPPQHRGVPVYDWRALQRWNISENRLPPGGSVYFRQPSIWALYRWHFAGAAGLLVFQTFLIAMLLLHKRRRGRAEHELRQSEQRLRLITNALPVLIAYVDSDQRYRFNNDAYKAWFGVSSEEAWGRTIREVVGEEFYRHAIAYVERVLSGQRVRYAQEMDLNGHRVSIDAIYVPDLDEQGAVRGFYVLVMDVTERNLAQQESKRLQDELLHAGRISTMGELAGTLAHEINQPLSAIMSNAQAAKRFLDAPAPDIEEVKEILHDIVKEDARAGEVIHRLRALLRKAKIEFEPIDLNSIFHEVIGLLRSDAVIRDVKLVTELNAQLPLIRGDRIQLQQVALNLILNAFESMAEQPRDERRVLVRTSQRDGEVLASVADSGKGLPAGETEKVFKPFFTTKPQGLGMGLSISHTIINRHHGRIWVENNPVGGATFYFSLPVPTGERQASGE